jgi:magnesium-transporting ATPase (P-type)
MVVVQAWMSAGTVRVRGEGYGPVAEIEVDDAARPALEALARAALLCSTGRAVERDGQWVADGDPMEAAFDVFARRVGVEVDRAAVRSRAPFDPRRRRMSVVAEGRLIVKGATDSVLPCCLDVGDEVGAAVDRMAAVGLRVLAIATRCVPAGETATVEGERDLELLGIVGLVDPVRPDVADAVAACRRAGIRLAMITGDHPATARAVAAEVGLLGPHELVVEGRELPADDNHLGALLDRDGVVVCRVTPEQKLRIARSLQGRGHVVAMTGDGVNDAPALRKADIGIAMGASGTDVAREAADLVLLDDHFATIVAAIEQGRATFANIRRFLTYHLTDNVAELAPFAAWALTGGTYPLALSVLQVLALDIGTDLLPALALGSEPPNRRTLTGPPRTGELIDRGVLARAFGVLGPVEAAVELSAFTAVLLAAGWHWGVEPAPAVLATASGAAFAAVVLGQLGNAFACRSEWRSVLGMPLLGNRLLLGAVAVEAVLLVVFLVPPVAGVLGGTWPSALGWTVAAAAIPAVLGADAAAKAVRRRGPTSRRGGLPGPARQRPSAGA